MKTNLRKRKAEQFVTCYIITQEQHYSSCIIVNSIKMGMSSVTLGDGKTFVHVQPLPVNEVKKKKQKKRNKREERGDIERDTAESGGRWWPLC